MELPFDLKLKTQEYIDITEVKNKKYGGRPIPQDETETWSAILDEYNRNKQEKVKLDDLLEYIRIKNQFCKEPVNGNENTASISKENQIPLQCPYFKPGAIVPKIDFGKLLASKHVRIINLDKILESKDVLSKADIQELSKQILDIENSESRINSVVLCRLDELKYLDETKTSDLDETKCSRYFLPPLARNGDQKEELELFYKLQAQLCSLGVKVPVVTIVTGELAYSTFPFIFSASYVVLTERFKLDVSLSPGTTVTSCKSLDVQKAGDRVVYPFSGLSLWSKICPRRKLEGCKRGVARFMLNSPNLVLRSPEFIDVGLAVGLVSSGKAGQLLESVIGAAGCPPPHTKMAIQSVSVEKFEYPGPSKISTWENEISGYFAIDNQIDELVETLGSLNKSWSEKYLLGILSSDKLFAEKIDRLLAQMNELSYGECMDLELSHALGFWEEYANPGC